ncbi:SURF1 family protein [Luteococcus sediminum]
MRKLWLRWTALVLFVVLLAAAFIRLGEWQLHRLDWRREVNARIVAYQQQPVKPYQEVFGGEVRDDQQWQRVRVRGTFDAAHEIQAMYRNQADQAGSEAITPMRTEQGDWILVSRGFLPRSRGANEVAVLPPPPKGTVEVVGYVRRSENGKPNAITPVDAKVRLVNSEAISQTLPYRALDGYVGVISSTPPQGGGLEPMVPPELTEGPHLSYAMQWFTFTVIAVAGVGVLIRNDLRDKRRAEAKAQRLATREPEPTAGPGTNQEDDDATRT